MPSSSSSLLSISSLGEWEHLLTSLSSPSKVKVWGIVAFFWADFHEASKDGGSMDVVFQELGKVYGSPSPPLVSPNANGRGEDEKKDADKNANGDGNENEKDYRLLFVKIEAEEVPELSMECDISVVPSFVFFKVQPNSNSSANNNDKKTDQGRGGGEEEVDGEGAVKISVKVQEKMEGVHPSELSQKVATFASYLENVSSSFSASHHQQHKMMDKGNNYNKNGKEMEEAGLLSPEEINSQIEKIINSSLVVMIMKGTPETPKCGFSRQMVGLLNENDIKFAYFDILTNPTIRAAIKEYSQWPTFPQIYVRGQLIGGLDIVKEMKEEAPNGDLKEAFEINDGDMGQDSTTFEYLLTSGDDNNKVMTLEEKLHSLINKASIMLFMKGEPDVPRCGFSKQMIQIFREQNVTKFEYFDILTDDEVREGLKKYSNWPTYPQLYIKGELIGGLDIVKELIDTDDFSEIIQDAIN